MYECAYMVVLDKVCIMRWDSELEEGVLTIIWCSGVVTGPNMLTRDQSNNINTAHFDIH